MVPPDLLVFSFQQHMIKRHPENDVWPTDKDDRYKYRLWTLKTPAKLAKSPLMTSETLKFNAADTRSSAAALDFSRVYNTKALKSFAARSNLYKDMRLLVITPSACRAGGGTTVDLTSEGGDALPRLSAVKEELGKRTRSPSVLSGIDEIENESDKDGAITRSRSQRSRSRSKSSGH